jgi:hypothetical protein
MVEWPQNPHSLPPPSREPQWFAYVDERHLGPFSTGEVQSKLIDESLGPDDFLWKNGMADWDPISEIELFYPDALVSAETPATNSPETKTYVRTRDIKIENVAFSTPVSGENVVTTRRLTITTRMIASTIFILTIAYGAAHWNAGHSRRLASIDDISVEDGRNLRNAAETPVHGGLPTGEFALVLGSLGTPNFYVGANSPDGTLLTLRLEGIPETLLSRSPILITQKITIRDHAGRSDPFQRQGGQSLVRGKYRLTLNSVDGSKISEKTLFLGGIDDENYRQNLTAMRATLPKQRAGELTELHQITGALEDLLVQTIVRFQSPKRWPEFSRQWSLFGKQLEQELRPTPTDEVDVVYLNLFNKARAILSQVLKTHADQTRALLDRTDRERLELEIAQTSTIAQSGILALQGEIALAEKKLAPTKRK